MASRPRRSPKQRRAIALLGTVVAVTIVVVSFLALKTKPTVVELVLSAREASFEVLPLAEAMDEERGAEAPLALQQIELLAPELEVSALQVRSASCVEATLPDGPVALLPAAGGSTNVWMAEPFVPEVVLRETTVVSVVPVGRSVSFDLAPTKRAGDVALAKAGEGGLCPELPPGRGWEGSVPIGEGMRVRLQNVTARAAAAARPVAMGGDFDVPLEAAGFSVFSTEPASQLSLAFPPIPEPSTSMRILDPAAGTVTEPQSLPVALDGSRSFAWQEKLVLLEPASVAAAPIQLLRPDLSLRSLELEREKLEAESFVLGGKVRFPSGEGKTLELEPGTFVSLAIHPKRPFRLRSLALEQGALSLVLWGEPKSLRVGFTPDLRDEKLPSYFEWLYAHQRTQLLYATLAYVIGVSLAVFKFFGWIKQ